MHVNSHSKKFHIILIGSVLFAVHLWISFVSFHYSYLGIQVKPAEANSWVISNFYSGSAAPASGLKLYDEVLRIDGRPVMQHFSVPLFHSIEQAREIEVLRQNQTLTYTIYDVESPVFSRSLLNYTAELIMFTVAAVIYTKAALTTSTRLLILVFILMGLSFMCAEASSRADVLAKFILLGSMTLIPLLVIHFMYRLLKEKGQSFFSFTWIKLCYCIVIPLALLRVVYFFHLSSYTYYSFDRRFALLCFAAGSALSLIFLVFLYIKRRHEYSYSANIIKTMFFAFGISFTPYVLLSAIPDMFGKQFISYSYTSWFILLFPIFFFYLAYKRKLFNIKWAGIEKKLQLLLGMLAYRSNPMIPAMHQIIRRLINIQKPEDLRNYFLPDLCSALGLKHAAICINYCSHTVFLAHGDMNKEGIMRAFHSDTLPETDYYVFDIVHDQNYSCYLITERPHRPLNAALQQWLETMRSPLTLVIENIHLNKRLSYGIPSLALEAAAASDEPASHSLWINNLTFQLQEQERARIASDLHDTLLQDIYFARKRVLAILGSKMSLNEMNGALQELAEFLDIINLNAREAAFLLYPHQLKEAGFAVALSNLIETERGIVPYKLHLRMENPKEWDALSSDILLQLFRISQELLTNAKKHSKANHVSFHFYRTDRHYTLHYVDDGIGIVNPSRKDAMGWIGIRQRAQNIEADIEVTTSAGMGLDVTIILAEG